MVSYHLLGCLFYCPKKWGCWGGEVVFAGMMRKHVTWRDLVKLFIDKRWWWTWWVGCSTITGAGKCCILRTAALQNVELSSRWRSTGLLLSDSGESMELFDRKVIASALFMLWYYSLLDRQDFHCKYFPTNVSKDREQKTFLPTCTSQDEVLVFWQTSHNSWSIFSSSWYRKKHFLFPFLLKLYL